MTAMPTAPIFRHIVAESLAFNGQLIPNHQSTTLPNTAGDNLLLSIAQPDLAAIL